MLRVHFCLFFNQSHPFGTSYWTGHCHLRFALKRFIAGRGLPADIYSDNGTNFVGAEAGLKEVYQLHRDRLTQEALQQWAGSSGIQNNSAFS